MTAAINISDEEQSPDQPTNETKAGEAQPDEAKIEQAYEVRREQPARAIREQPEGAGEEPRANATMEDRNVGNGKESP